MQLHCAQPGKRISSLQRWWMDGCTRWVKNEVRKKKQSDWLDSGEEWRLLFIHLPETVWGVGRPTWAPQLQLTSFVRTDQEHTCVLCLCFSPPAANSLSVFGHAHVSTIYAFVVVNCIGLMSFVWLNLFDWLGPSCGGFASVSAPRHSQKTSM